MPFLSIPSPCVHAVACIRDIDSRVMSTANPPLPWLAQGKAFPPIHTAWGQDSVAPGLLCAGGDLSVDSLKRAYQDSIFPWFSGDQPILWWSPDPRMVLDVADFRTHPSFKKVLKKFVRSPECEIRIDSAFEYVIHACATSLRDGQAGSWIVPEMISAYTGLHHAGFAHSVETWVDGQLVGGLYFMAIGQSVFGESMFHYATDGSKIALAALICMCRHFGIQQIDCQQNTRHLASLGAREIPRSHFADSVRKFALTPGPMWKFSPIYWNDIASLNPYQSDPTPCARI